MATPSVVDYKVIRTGVTALARETGFSQPYVSKLLARGYPADFIREKAELGEARRYLRAMKKAGRGN